MSGEQSSLEVCSYKIRPKNFRRTNLTKHSSRVSFLYSNSRWKYKRQGTLFIGESALEDKREGEGQPRLDIL